MSKVFIGVLVVTVAMIVIFGVVEANNAQYAQNLANVTTQLVQEGTISVSINGEIVRAGTYLLEENTCLADLLEVAGGVTTNADELAYDVSYLLQDGYSFYIAPKYDNTDVCSLEPIKKVNINSDNASTLQTVNGIGSSVANAIVSYREANGLFGRIEDIKNVNGIGNATFEKVKNNIVLRNA